LVKPVNKYQNNTMRKLALLSILLISGFYQSIAQTSLGSELNNIDYSRPKEYEIGGITVSGVETLDRNVLIMLSGLSVGDKITIPGDKLSKAIESLWAQGLFADIEIGASKIQGGTIFLDIYLEERSKLAKFSFRGVKKSEADDLREKIKLTRGQVVTENSKSNAKRIISNFFIDKGYLNVQVDVKETTDETIKKNETILVIDVNKKTKVKIQQIIFKGNEEIADKKLRRYMKETKQKTWWNIFKSSKYIEANFKADKKLLIAKYNAAGFRDAQVVRDSMYKVSEERVNLEIEISEGKKFYFRNINWVGNSKHTAEELSRVLGIKKGDVYDQSVLETRLFMNQNGNDVTSLYMDDGYLFFQVNPVEVLVENDSIDLEMRMYEGKQARINKVTVSGNTKTNDHVILREIRTVPGELFSRADIIRTQRELSQLGYFNPETIGVEPIPNQADGTVDIEYKVEERPSDQIELSGGWGMGMIIGTLGVSFNNFSAANIFKKNAWKPLPAGDGQRLSLRAQSNGLFFQSYNASFTEPWLGGKKPNSLSVSVFRSIQSNGIKRSDARRQGIDITGVSVGLGKRLEWPDDYFTLYRELTYQKYDIQKWPNFIFNDGKSNNFSFKFLLARNSIDQPIYPRKGSETKFMLQFTPPYSLIKESGMDEKPNYNDMTLQDKFEWVEYHKWKFTTSWFSTVVGDLVLNTRAGFGFLGSYNRGIGAAPFERFYLGGSGLTGFNIDGREIVALRGYDDLSLAPITGATIISKYTAELRYPVSLNPSATIFVMGFAEAGNTWVDYKNYNPFDVKRSMGVGVRIFLPMFGLFGLDYGWGFDSVPNNPSTGNGKGQFHFTIGMNLGEL
jgi:outer membrane protein insertion porin family